MAVTKWRVVRVVLVFCLVFLAGALFLAAQSKSPAASSLESLLNGSSSDIPDVLSSLADADLPLALAVADALKFKALHGDSPLKPESIDSFKAVLMNRLESSKIVSLEGSTTCSHLIPVRDVFLAGQKITIPTHFRASIPLTITDFNPQGEAGNLFPDITVSFITDNPPVKAVLTLDGRPLSPVKIEAGQVVFRPSLVQGSLLSVGSHTASVTLSDGLGASASHSWSFSVGLSPVPSLAVPAEAFQVATLTLPIEALIPGSEASGTVIVIVRESPDGRRFYEYSISRAGLAVTTRNLYLLTEILKNPRASRGVTIFPKTGVMFPNTPLTFSFSYDGPGSVIKSTWVFTGFSGASVVHASTASATFTTRYAALNCQVTVRIPAPDHDPPYIDAKVSADKGIYPILIDLTPETTRQFSGKQGANSVTINAERYVTCYPSGAVVNGTFLEGNSFPIGEAGTLKIDRARWHLVGENPGVTIENAEASQSRLIFKAPGAAELVHEVSMTLSWDGDYKWSFVPKQSSLAAYYPISIQTRFGKFPRGIIGGTSRKVQVDAYDFTINGQKRSVTPATGARFDPPWVLARPVIFPNSPALELSQLYPVFLIKQPDLMSLPSSDGFDTALDYDGSPLPGSQIPLRIYFSFYSISLTSRFDPDDYDFLIPSGDWQSIPAFSAPADLVDVEISPSAPQPLPENQTMNFSGVLVPKPNLGEGRIDKDGGTMDLLDTYEVTSWEPPSWNALLGEDVVQTLANVWEFPFTSQISSGTYIIKAATTLKLKEKDTGSVAEIKGSGRVSLKAVSGLKIESPRQDLTYPKDWIVKVVTSLDKDQAGWETLKWFVNDKEVKPNTTVPPWTLELNKIGTWTLKVSQPDPANPQIELASDTVTFRVKPVSVSINPTRKIVAFVPNQEIDFQTTVELDGHQLPKPGEYANWGSKWKATVKNVEWKGITVPNGCAPLEPDQNNFIEAKTSFQTPGAETVLATVTIQIEPQKVTKNTPPEILTFPAVRADLWSIPTPTLISLTGHLPTIALLGAGRTFDVASGVIKLGQVEHKWFAASGFDPEIEYAPALFDPKVEKASCKKINFKWDGPLKKDDIGPTFVPVFPSSGTAKIHLLTTLDFEINEIPLTDLTYPVIVKSIADVVEKKIVPSSFTMLLGEQNKFEFIYEIKPDFEKEFAIAMNSPAWSQVGVVIGNSNPFTYTANGPGDVRIDFKSIFSYVESDFSPPAPGGNDFVSDFVNGTVNEVILGLKEVSFTGPNYHMVKKDDGTQDYAAPHWQDNSSPLDGDADDPGDRKYPICFTRNTKMKVSAKWAIKPAGLNVSIIIKGDGPGNLVFPETAAVVNGSELIVTDVECLNPFVNEIAFFDPLSINWHFSIDGGLTWRDAGTSTNQTYITLGDPLTTVFHTLAQLGCKNAAGESTVQACTEKIWNEFIDRDVRRADGVQLTYYSSYNCSNVTTADLLAKGDGQCGAWAKLFIDMRKVQGIDDLNEYVIFEPIIDDGFIVKNWSFSGPGSSGIASHPYLNIPDSPIVLPTSYNWKFAEVNDEPGIPGQGNPNPASLFSNHQVVISGQYYDPSYGLKHASLEEIDDNAIDGFYRGPGLLPVDEPAVNLDLNGDGDKTDLGVKTSVIIFRKNSPGLDIKETKLDY